MKALCDISIIIFWLQGGRRGQKETLEGGFMGVRITTRLDFLDVG